MIKIKPTEGLCNYLRVIFSYNQYARDEGKKLYVIWRVTNYCNGKFSDLFEKVDGIEIKEYCTRYIFEKDIFYEGFDQNEKYTPDYTNLKPLQNIQNKINTFVDNIGEDFIAIHVRRTDNSSSEILSPDKDFFNFIEENPKYKVYLATDNMNTQNMFIEKYGERIIFYEKIQKNRNIIRKTSLEHTVIDIFICSKALKFKGSGYSSLSDLICSLRK